VPLIAQWSRCTLRVVNDALGSFLLRANEVIDQVPMSACDAVDGSSTGTRVPRMWALLRLP
jgi:hypothetical protein